jgi:hypothetical protein
MESFGFRLFFCPLCGAFTGFDISFDGRICWLCEHELEAFEH